MKNIEYITVKNRLCNNDDSNKVTNEDVNNAVDITVDEVNVQLDDIANNV